MRTVTLGSVTEDVATWHPRTSGKSAFTYIDLSAVDNRSKRITAPAEIACADAPSRARQLVREGDVLVSTVRPNLNAAAMVASDYNGATASTGFTVLRPGPDVSSRYLFHWVTSPSFVGDMVRKATGASYPAVSDAIIKGSLLSLPPMEEQRRIAAILDQADVIRTKRRQVLAHLDTVPEVLFRAEFGDTPASVTVEALAARDKGSIRTGPFGSQLLHSEFVDEGVAVLGLDNVVGNAFTWGERRFITNEKYEKLKRYTVRGGDVLISIMGTTGRCVVIPENIPPAINTKHICAITPDRTRVLPDFLRASFLWHPDSRSYLRRQTKGSIMDGLNMGIIKRMPVPVAPLDRQLRFSRVLAAIEQSRAPVARAARKDDELFAALQSRAFRGEL